MRRQYRIKTEVGNIYLVASPKGLQGLYVNQQDLPVLKSLQANDPTTKILTQAARELEEYLAAKRKKFTVLLDIAEGTPFQKRVWEALQKIPYGKTCSYKELAASIGSKAIRAVGSANGKNPLCIIIPCHRVITSDGKLGGYSSGIELKIKLLALEQIQVKP